MRAFYLPRFFHTASAGSMSPRWSVVTSESIREALAGLPQRREWLCAMAAQRDACARQGRPAVAALWAALAAELAEVCGADDAALAALDRNTAWAISPRDPGSPVDSGAAD